MLDKTLHCTISWRSRIAFLKLFVSKYLYIYVYLRKKTFVPETLQDLDCKGKIVAKFLIRNRFLST